MDRDRTGSGQRLGMLFDLKQVSSAGDLARSRSEPPTSWSLLRLSRSEIYVTREAAKGTGRNSAILRTSCGRGDSL